MPGSEPQAQLQVAFAQDLPELTKGQTIDLTTPRFTIGRSETCDLCLNDARISRQHTELTLKGERYHLADCGSANGTFLNGEPLKGKPPQPLKDEDEIGVGALLVLRFKDFAGTVMDLRPALRRRGLHLGASREEVFVNYQRIEPPLAELAFQLLKVLYQHAGELVELEAIARAVWPDLKGAVSEAMINNQVARLRQRLSQLDPGHDYIERLRGKGLRFVQRPR